MDKNELITQNFAGTIAEGLYKPVYFTSSGSKTAVAVAVSLELMAIPALTMVNKDDNISKLLDSLKASKDQAFVNLWGNLKSLWLTLNGKMQLDKVRTECNAFIQNSRDEFEMYKVAHEEILMQMQGEVDRINRNKTLMKDHLLKKLCVTLNKMGIESTLEDWQTEHLDLRNFPINETFNLMKPKIWESINKMETALNIFGNVPIIGREVNNSLEKELRKSLETIQTTDKYNREQMNKELGHLYSILALLKNVANIYSDIVDNLSPIMEKLLIELETRYGNNINLLPKKKREALCILKNLFKDMSEAILLPKSSVGNLAEKMTVESNKLSKEYDKIKKVVSFELYEAA